MAGDITVYVWWKIKKQINVGTRHVYKLTIKLKLKLNNILSDI